MSSEKLPRYRPDGIMVKRLDQVSPGEYTGIFLSKKGWAFYGKVVKITGTPQPGNPAVSVECENGSDIILAGGTAAQKFSDLGIGRQT